MYLTLATTAVVSLAAGVATNYVITRKFQQEALKMLPSHEAKKHLESPYVTGGKIVAITLASMVVILMAQRFDQRIPEIASLNLGTT